MRGNVADKVTAKAAARVTFTEGDNVLPIPNLIEHQTKSWKEFKDYGLREVFEELGLEATSVSFNHSRYYPRSNTLMLNFTVTVPEENAHPNWEIDNWRWFTTEEARQNIRPGSLAEAFLDGYLDGGEYHFPDL